MTKGVKFLLIGCVSVLVIGFIAAGVGTYIVGSWFKKKTETVGNLLGTKDSEYGQKIEELKKEYPFTPRADNMITEGQLLRFLAVRKDIYQVWKSHEAEFKKLSEQKNPDLAGAFKGLEVFNEARKVQANSLARQRMNPDEYRYLAQIIYTTWVARGTKEFLKDKSIKETGEEQLDKQIDNLDKQIQDARTNEEVKKQLQNLRDQLQKQKDDLVNSGNLDKMDEVLNSIPQANLDLFVKHEAEIQQYNMAGLEMLGL